MSQTELGFVNEVKDVCHTFELHLRNFSRSRSKFRQLGIVGLFPDKSGPKSIRTSTLAAGIVQLYRKGRSCYDIATQLGISGSTVRRILKEQGVPLRSPLDNHQPLPLTDDDGELQPPAVQPPAMQQIEVKTIRRKLNEITQRGQAAEWHRRLARRRAEQQPSALATLYVDGHVRAYHGQHRIGKTHVSRLKRVLRAETDYWVHRAHGQPLLVVHESVDSSFRKTLRDGVLPEIRRVVGNRRVRIVFDREGWSRELFDDLLSLNFDFMTYRKGPYEPLADSEFAAATFGVPGQPAVHYELAETVFKQAGWPRLRLVAVKKKNGGVSVVDVPPLEPRELVQVHADGICVGCVSGLLGGVG